MTKSSNAANLRKQCRRRGLTLRVLHGETVTISDAQGLVFGPGDAGAGRDWLADAFPRGAGRPRSAPSPKAKRIMERLPALDARDPGEESDDLTPADYRGLVATEIELPEWLEADAALIALWRHEWRGRAKLATLAPARRALKGRLVRRRLVLSDADRASLASYKASPAEVFTAAALVPKPGRQKGWTPPGKAP